MFTEMILYIKTAFCSFLSALLLLLSCNNNQEKAYESGTLVEQDSAYKNGYYCSTVTYTNPNTATISTYTLTVEVEENKVIKIFWPNGGWLDDSHFTPKEVDESGLVEFDSDKGYHYKIKLESFGVCETK